MGSYLLKMIHAQKKKSSFLLSFLSFLLFCLINKKIIPKNRNKYKPYHITYRRGDVYVKQTGYGKSYTGTYIPAGRAGACGDHIHN